jgi:aspartate aminotransferase
VTLLPVARKIAESSAQGSWIRRMFEEGMRLKGLYGADEVCDLSIGNPNVEPPQAFHDVVNELLLEPTPGLHGYMPNAGYPEVRQALARCLSEEQGVEVPAGNVLMTVGAAGGLNVALKTILDPGDEVIFTRPYFVEYGFYVDNFQGVPKPVPASADFDLDVSAIEAAIGERTRAVLINSPNNPTGRVYPHETLAALGELLAAKSRSLGRTVYLLSDEPYRRIVYDGTIVPPVFQVYENSIIVSSYSKELSLAGERIGYLAAHPALEGVEMLMQGMCFATRVLGFVNAPALMQRAVGRLHGATVDMRTYERNRAVLLQGLAAAGYEVPLAQGGFYLFPRSPLSDDVAFANEMAEQRVLVVPGVGFGEQGHFRLSYCVAPDVVDRALPAFERLGRKYLA